MKSIFLSITIMFLVGCGNAVELEKELYHVGFVFTKYTQNNFLITPEGYNGDYESIGLITTVLYPEVKKVSIKDLNENWQKLGEYWSVKKIDANEAIDSMYAIAVKHGANAIIRFDTKVISKPNGIFNIYGWEVSGFAIKRK